MATGAVGIDSVSPAGSTNPGAGDRRIWQHAVILGAVFPRAWSGQFCGKCGHDKLQPLGVQFLNANGIRVLPVARQTPALGSDDPTARAHAALNAQALFEAFPPADLYGADPDVLVFLDVEEGAPLSQAYYAGWSDELIKQGTALSSGTVNLHPAVYMGKANTASAAALTAAVGAGAVCAGVWIARYWQNQCIPPADWDDTLVTPAGGLPCPILAWQYADACGSFDSSQANPGHQDILLNRLVLPPSTAVSV